MNDFSEHRALPVKSLLVRAKSSVMVVDVDKPPTESPRIPLIYEVRSLIGAVQPYKTATVVEPVNSL